MVLVRKFILFFPLYGGFAFCFLYYGIRPFNRTSHTYPHLRHTLLPHSSFLLIKPATMSIDHREILYSEHDEGNEIRDIYAVTPRSELPSGTGRLSRRPEVSENISRRSSSMSEVSSENFTSLSREFNALVLAGSSLESGNTNNINDTNGSMDHSNLLASIQEDEPVEANQLAVIPDRGAVDRARLSPTRMSLQRIQKEEVEAKISAWQANKLAKINNRFKREDAIIQGWESAQIDKATSKMKRIEKKLEETRARSNEKMQNEIAKARRKAEEKKASTEAKRARRAAKVIQLASLMRAVGRAPSKNSFF